jgi:hypothetical protein
MSKDQNPLELRVQPPFNVERVVQDCVVQPYPALSTAVQVCEVAQRSLRPWRDWRLRMQGHSGMIHLLSEVLHYHYGGPRGVLGEA